MLLVVTNGSLVQTGGLVGGFLSSGMLLSAAGCALLAHSGSEHLKLAKAEATWATHPSIYEHAGCMWIPTRIDSASIASGKYVRRRGVDCKGRIFVRVQQGERSTAARL